jgi:hypothetical protein
MEQDTSEICKKDSDCEDFSVKIKKINDLTWYEVRYIGNFVGSNNPELSTAM